jgi:polyhydroxyalkanoate synthesis regulator phasin
MPSFGNAALQATTPTTPPTTEIVVSDETTTDETTTDDTTTDDATTDDATEVHADTPDSPSSDADREARATERIRTELQDLVDEGTITAAQADAVAADLAASLPGRGHGGPGGHHRHPGFDGEVLAGLLGIDVETLRSELRSGDAIAEIAAEQGVDVQTAIDSLVAEANEHLDLSVENGRLTQEEADAKLADVTERITDFVNNGRPDRG